MSTEDESWRKHFSGEGNQGDGQRPRRTSYNGQARSYQRRDYSSNGGTYNNGGRREGGYSNRENNGYSHREGNGYSQREGSYYQRENGGYQRREGSNNRPEGGYGRPARSYNRPEGNDNRPGGYQKREGGYRGHQYGGYRQREEEGQARPYNREGGYRQGGNSYGQRSQEGGFRKRTQGYNPHAKYSMKKQIEYKEKHFDPDEPVRLNRYLSNAGVCSRREADTFIQAGVVKVNGVVVTELGTKVKRSDEVMFHDQTINMEKKVYVLLNKPKDYVTTSDDPQNRKTVMDLVKNACRERIYPVGRLDRNTTGVLLLTNDGDLATKLTHPQYLKKKIYHVFCDRNVTAADMRQIADGIMLDDGEIHADAIDYASDTDKKQVGIEIHSGRNRIVRRIFEHLGYKVVKLDRVYFAGLTKKNVKRGDWRFLTQEEVNMLKMGAFE